MKRDFWYDGRSIFKSDWIEPVSHTGVLIIEPLLEKQKYNTTLTYDAYTV